MDILNIEWLNRNSQRAYPFQEDMQRRPVVDGVLLSDYRIPNCAILDLLLSTNIDPSPTVFLSVMTLTPNVITAVISDVESGEILASVSGVLTEDAEFTPVNFVGAGTHDDIRGTIVFGSAKAIADAIPDGIYTFESSETTFEARCVRPSVPCVSGLYISDVGQTYESRRLRGDVALVAGRNIVLDYDEQNNAIIINADDTYGFNDPCGCNTDNRTQVSSVNGISVGRVRIEGGDCISVETDSASGRITITDTCSKPCCGCAELSFLNEKTNSISTAMSKLEGFATVLEAKMAELSRNALLTEMSSIRYV